jgi:putative transposase
MGRKPRIEFEGAVYHVFNHGSGRPELFATPANAEAFIGCLFDACERMQWRLHAYCLTRDRYHLALETPRGNLVNGVHWLQSAFGNRLPRSHGAVRRIFQARYHAILIEPGAPLAELVDGLHLLPVRAGLVTLPQLAQFRWSSYRAFARGGGSPRPAALSADWLSARPGAEDSAAGWRGYADHLAGLLADDTGRHAAAFARLCRGWVYGSEAYRRDRRSDFSRMAAAKDWGGAKLAELNRREWETRLEAGARALGRDLPPAEADPKSAPWKVALAAWLKRHTSATNRWLTERLHMGPPDAVSRYVGEVRIGKRPAAREFLSGLS